MAVAGEAATISFPFPGPADYPLGVISGLLNFEAFHEPVAL